MNNHKENKIILYQDENGITRVSVRFSDDDLWLTQHQIAEIYDTSQPNISQHIDGILRDGELDEVATHKKYLLVQTEGKRQIKREISHYNLDMIISIGYRVQSQIAVRFRRWATKRLHEYIQKGFTMDDERLKQGGSRLPVALVYHETFDDKRLALKREFAIKKLTRAQKENLIG